MKLKINSQVAQEIEVDFPISFKESEGVYIHCYNENNCIVIYESSGHFSRYGANTALNQYTPSMNCDKSEVEAAFRKVIKMAENEVLNPVVIDLYSNTPTEELENLNTILFGHDEG
jgi:hypothetical protein